MEKIEIKESPHGEKYVEYSTVSEGMEIIKSLGIDDEIRMKVVLRLGNIQKITKSPTMRLAISGRPYYNRTDNCFDPFDCYLLDEILKSESLLTPEEKMALEEERRKKEERQALLLIENADDTIEKLKKLKELMSFVADLVKEEKTQMRVKLAKNNDILL